MDHRTPAERVLYQDMHVRSMISLKVLQPAETAIDRAVHWTVADRYDEEFRFSILMTMEIRMLSALQARVRHA